MTLILNWFDLIAFCAWVIFFARMIYQHGYDNGRFDEQMEKEEL